MSQRRWTTRNESSNDIDCPSVLVTGASSGIGLAVVELLVHKGYHVWATSRRPERSERLLQLSKELAEVHIHPMDVSDDAAVQDSVQRLLATWGTVDAVINNAGFGVFGPAETLTLEQVRSMFEANYLGVLRVEQAVLPTMRNQRSGRIINISSNAGATPSYALPEYSATKFALQAHTMAQARNLEPWNIHCSLVLPGPVLTDFVENTQMGTAFGKDNPYEAVVQKDWNSWMQAMEAGQPPAEVAQTVLKALEDPSPHLWYPTSDKVLQSLERHYHDASGGSFAELLGLRSSRK